MSVRGSVGRSVRPSRISQKPRIQGNYRKFNWIPQNSRLFASAGRVTALLVACTQLCKPLTVGWSVCLSYFTLLLLFLVACTRFYTSRCRFVCPSIQNHFFRRLELKREQIWVAAPAPLPYSPCPVGGAHSNATDAAVYTALFPESEYTHQMLSKKNVYKNVEAQNS